MIADRRAVRLGGALALAAAALLLPLLPPAEGPMLVMSWGAAPAAIAVANGATLLGKGPWPGSLVVSGSRRRLVPALLAAGGIAVAAPALLCSRTEAV